MLPRATFWECCYVSLFHLLSLHSCCLFSSLMLMWWCFPEFTETLPLKIINVFQPHGFRYYLCVHNSQIFIAILDCHVKTEFVLRWTDSLFSLSLPSSPSFFFLMTLEYIWSCWSNVITSLNVRSCFCSVPPFLLPGL